jgi:Fe-S-cluster containining protein
MYRDHLNADSWPERHSLSSGTPYRSHGCHVCCVDTRMSLSSSDIERIVGRGHRFKDFVLKRERGRYLRNEKGRCVFLGEEGCRIYPFRPEGCRIYPLVYDEHSGRAAVHDLCPFRDEFKFNGRDVEALTSFINKRPKKDKQPALAPKEAPGKGQDHISS